MAKRIYAQVFIVVASRYAADKNEVRADVSELWRIFAMVKSVSQNLNHRRAREVVAVARRR